MSTAWDDDRLRSKVVDWTPGQGQQIGLGQKHGFVARVYDHGPADGRKDGTLVLDSNVRHGSAGVFATEAEANDYAGRVCAALLLMERERERISHDRRDRLPELQGERWRRRNEAREEAREANARAKAEQAEAERLSHEAEAPGLSLDCPLRGTGYRILVDPNLSDGTHEATEGTVLHDTVGPDRPGAPRPKRKAKARPRAAPSAPEALPQQVMDADGRPIGKGSKVDYPGAMIEGAEVLRIVAIRDGLFIVEIEDSAGIMTEVPSDELVGLDTEPPADDWPE